MRVVVEETVATCEPPNNGSGPLWSWGAPLVVRQGDNVSISIMETSANVPPLCNTRPRLFRKEATGSWRLVWHPEGFREREPCPLVGFPDGRLLLSLNTSLTPPGTYYQACAPHLLEFHPTSFSAPEVSRPTFPRTATFTDHSYRGIAADGAQGEILLLHIDSRTSTYHYALRDKEGKWSPPGTLSFPIRCCYPQVALRNSAAYVLAIGDIVEPISEWRQYKRERTGREWDYVFRRLFFSWTPNVLSEPFSEPIEIDNVDATGGHITNLDLWIDHNGVAHLLYLRQQTTELLRERFFPHMALRTSLQYCTVNQKLVLQHYTLGEGGEGLHTQQPRYARFHSTDGRRLFVVLATTAPNGTWHNAIMPLLPKREEPVALQLREAFTAFFTASERGGSKPSRTLDIFGICGDPKALQYAQVKL